MFTSDLLTKLYETSLRTKLFVFEDVYIGQLASILNSKFDSTFPWLYFYYSHENVLNATHRDFDDAFFIYTDYYIDIVIIWDLMQRRFYETLFNLDFYNLNF